METKGFQVQKLETPCDNGIKTTCSIREMDMGITLPSGLTITEAEGRILRFAENEYAYYDGIPSTQPNHITPVDVMVTNAINSNVNTADKIREVHLGLAEACDPILPMIPEETTLIRS